jgi:hypothetical protein
MVISNRSTNRSRMVVRWLARVAGTLLLVRHARDGVFEAAKLVTERWVYADRIYSIGFLAMLVGLILGWLSDRAAAGLLVAGYLLAAGAPFLGTTSSPLPVADPAALALHLMPLLLVGLAYVYSGTRRRPSV